MRNSNDLACCSRDGLLTLLFLLLSLSLPSALPFDPGKEHAHSHGEDRVRVSESPSSGPRIPHCLACAFPPPCLPITSSAPERRPAREHSTTARTDRRGCPLPRRPRRALGWRCSPSTGPATAATTGCTWPPSPRWPRAARRPSSPSEATPSCASATTTPRTPSWALVMRHTPLSGTDVMALAGIVNIAVFLGGLAFLASRFGRAALTASCFLVVMLFMWGIGYGWSNEYYLSILPGVGPFPLHPGVGALLLRLRPDRDVGPLRRRAAAGGRDTAGHGRSGRPSSDGAHVRPDLPRALGLAGPHDVGQALGRAPLSRRRRSRSPFCGGTPPC